MAKVTVPKKIRPVTAPRPVLPGEYNPRIPRSTGDVIGIPDDRVVPIPPKPGPFPTPPQPSPNQGTSSTSGWFKFRGIRFPGIPALPDWQPKYSPQWEEYITQMYERVRQFMQQPGMSEEEKALLRAKGIENIRQNVEALSKQVMQKIADMGLLGSPAAAKLLQRIAEAGARQAGEFERDLALEAMRRAFQEQATALGLGQRWAGMGTEIENLRNRLALAAAQYLFKKIMAQHEAAAAAASGAMRQQLLEEQINRARRMELFNLLRLLSGYLTGQQRAAIGEGELQNQRYQLEMQKYLMNQKSLSDFASSLGNLFMLAGGFL